MPSAEEIKQRIETGIPGAVAEVQDTTGTADHFRPRSRPRPSRACRASRSTASCTARSAQTSAGAIHALALKTQALESHTP